jgi:cytochrome c-type biogenesis protein CcmH
LAESNATFAKDMRNQIRLMMQQGKTDQEVIDFLVARYGDFILYQPPFKLKTVVLWLGPFIFLALAVSFLYSTISGHQKE